MNLRALLGSFQLPVAGLGLAMLAVAISSLLTIPEPPPGSDGFVGGLAVIFLTLIAWAGLIVLALGLAIPPAGGFGVRFNRYQRGLFVLAAVATFLAGAVPLVAFGLVLENPDMMVTSLLALATLAVLSLLGGVIWRLTDAVVDHLNGAPSAE